MASTPVGQLIDAYLADVAREADARGLSPHRRAELLDELGEHIAVARAESATPDDEATVRTVLDRLGDPVDIIGQEAVAAPATPPMAPPMMPPTMPPPMGAAARSRPSNVPLAVLAITAGVLSLICMLGLVSGEGALRPWHIAILMVVFLLIVAAAVVGIRMFVLGLRDR